MLGLALIISIAGACWVAAEHKCIHNIPSEIWFVPAVLGGVLVGTLIPFSTHKPDDPNSHESHLVPAPESMLGLAILILIALVAGVIGALDDHLAWCAVAASLGSVLFGLFIPSPGRRDT
jgi:UDP-N-acetylmuramyl pentapeptide phosphotransferase/UDP-N-acetylglucosamine-1-phosphate transferase